jgi:hypothetical protein
MSGMKGSSYLCSQITGGVESAAPLHADIPRTGGKGSDLPFEDVLQEYLQFPYDYFLLVLPFRGYCCKFCPPNNPRRKNHKDQDQVNMLAKRLHRYMCSVGSSLSVVETSHRVFLLVLTLERIA